MLASRRRTNYLNMRLEPEQPAFGVVKIIPSSGASTGSRLRDPGLLRRHVKVRTCSVCNQVMMVLMPLSPICRAALCDRHWRHGHLT